MIAQPPFKSPFLSGLRNLIENQWLRWLTTLYNAVNASTEQIGLVTLTAQAASITTTAIPAPTLTTGRYRVRWYTRVTQAASTSSSLIVAVGWTDGGVVQSSTGATLTGNVTTTVESNGVNLFTADSATTVTYTTTYASVGATPMQYSLTLTLERVP